MEGITLHKNCNSCREQIVKICTHDSISKCPSFLRQLKNVEVKAETWSNHWELQIFGDGNSSHLQIRYMCVINRYTVDAVWRTRRRRREKFQLWKGYLCDKWRGPSWYGVNSGWISSPSFCSSAAPSALLDIFLSLSLSRLALPVELTQNPLSIALQTRIASVPLRSQCTCSVQFLVETNQLQLRFQKP